MVRSTERTDAPEQVLFAEQVAGYLAKYATKSATDTGASDTAHHRRIRATVHELDDRAAEHRARTADDHYALLGHWSHMLGFRGHFASKSRHYSVTLGGLRRARQRAKALIAHTGTTAGHWTSPPEKRTCWPTRRTRPPWSSASGTSSVPGGYEAQTVSARVAAARAREYDQWRSEQRHKHRTSETGQGDG